MKHLFLFLLIASAGTTKAQNVGIGTTIPGYPLTVSMASPGTALVTGATVFAANSFSGNFNSCGVYGSSASPYGFNTTNGASGVLGEITSSIGGGYSAGVRGINRSTDMYGLGVVGYQAGSGYGVYGETVSGTGVYGTSSSGTGGIFFSGSGSAVIANAFGSSPVIQATNTNANNTAVVYASGNSSASGTVTSAATGVVGELTNTSGGVNSAGVRGINRSTNLYGIGVAGYQAGGGDGVYGETVSGDGVVGYSGSGSGGYFSSTSGTGLTTVSAGTGATLSVINVNNSATAGTIYATAISTVAGTATAGASALVGELTPTSGGVFSAGVRGINRSTNLYGVGVIGYQAGGGDGVYGETISGDGIVGYSGSGAGGYFSSTSGAGIISVSSGTGATLSATNINSSSSTGAIYGTSNSTIGSSTTGGASGVVGELTPTGNNTFSAGVRGINRSTGAGIGVVGYEAGSGYGVYGETVSGSGVYGYSAASGIGVTGVSASYEGGSFISNSGTAIAAYSPTGTALSALTDGTNHVIVASNTNTGNSAGTIYGISGSTVVSGAAASGGSAVVGEMTATLGGYFSAGLRGINRSTNGSGMGVVGYQAGTGIGVYGETASSGMGVSGYSPSGQGGNFGANSGTALVASSVGGTGANISSGTGTVLLANSGSSGNIAVFQAGGGNVARIDHAGKGYFNGGTQTGGADLAEAFAVEGNRNDYEPGDVLVISTIADRTVTKSNASYSTSVAGVYATKPGVLLTERMESETQSDLVPMGVVGVIPTKVCSENGPIHRGDLLVTSSIPGRAMKATASQIQYGSVIGKALEDFTAEGNGVIKVLVNVR